MQPRFVVRIVFALTKPTKSQSNAVHDPSNKLSVQKKNTRNLSSVLIKPETCSLHDNSAVTMATMTTTVVVVVVVVAERSTTLSRSTHANTRTPIRKNSSGSCSI